jgi:hypothetical protein
VSSRLRGEIFRSYDAHCVSSFFSIIALACTAERSLAALRPPADAGQLTEHDKTVAARQRTVNRG